MMLLVPTHVQPRCFQRRNTESDNRGKTAAAANRVVLPCPGSALKKPLGKATYGFQQPSVAHIGQEWRVCFGKKSPGWSSTVFFLVAHLVSGNHHTPGLPGSWQSWPLLNHINGQKSSCEGSWTVLWWSSLASCPKQINSSNFIHGKANISLHCQERNAACFSPPRFLRQLCHHFKDSAQLRVPRTCLPPSMTLSHRDTPDCLHKRSSFGKPGLVCLSLATNYQTQVSERSAKKLKSNLSERQKQIAEGQAGSRGVPKRSRVCWKEKKVKFF